MWQKTTMTVEIIKVIVRPLQLFISCIPVRDFWYYTMWNLNASSGRGAQWSRGKLRDDYATSQADMETCRCLDPAPTSEGDRIWVWCSGFEGAVLWTLWRILEHGHSCCYWRKWKMKWSDGRAVKMLYRKVSVGGNGNSSECNCSHVRLSLSCCTLNRCNCAVETASNCNKGNFYTFLHKPAQWLCLYLWVVGLN